MLTPNGIPNPYFKRVQDETIVSLGHLPNMLRMNHKPLTKKKSLLRKIVKPSPYSTNIVSPRQPRAARTKRNYSNFRRCVNLDEAIPNLTMNYRHDRFNSLQTTLQTIPSKPRVAKLRS